MNGSFSTSICADCGVHDPSWASINRGVLLCNDCCSVHRSLGRHISHVRSLQAPNWPPVLKETVFTLVKKGSNSLWEHLIHDNSHHHKIKVKKPSLKDPKDKLNASRQEFISCKYKNLLFLPRLSMKDHINSIEDLSKQLHASVRTNNLETCLRLISLGADPNYKHSDRGNTPLHVAAQAGQAMQVELLVVHGANPSMLDRLGHTPEECARIAGHHQLADRLIECQYELTDKLSFYLSGRTPVHSIGEHFLVPQGVGNDKNMAEARSRLQELSNELFEELAADIYDEVDRRETDAMWLTTQQLQSSVAFLPVNPTLSPLRNQSRQKLALLNSSEFTQLLVDILLDAKRRQQISVETGQTSGTVVPSTSEDKTAAFDPHDYDEVPVDEAKPTSPPQLKPEIQAKLHIPPPPSYPKPNPGQTAPSQQKPAPPSMSRLGHSRPPAPAPYRGPGMRTGAKSASMFVPGASATLYSEAYSTVDEIKENEPGGDGDYAEVNELPRKEVAATESEGNETVSKAKFNLIMERLKKVTAEKEELQVANEVLEEKVASLQAQLSKASEENARLRSSTSHSPLPPSPSTLSPIVEPNNELEESNPPDETHLYAQVDYNKKTSRKSSAVRLSGQEQVPQPEKYLEDLYSVPDKNKNSSSDSPPIVTPPPPRQDTPLSDSAFEESSEAAPAGTNPPVDLVHSHIKTLTQVIQELLKAAQGHKQAHFSPCSLKIARAVDSLTRIFPTKPGSQEVQVSLQEVKNAAQRLQTGCQDSGQSDMAYRTRQIISSAYDVAKAARHLVMCVEQDNKMNE